MIFNMTGGAVSTPGEPMSSILVTAPTGSVVTATQGDITKTAREEAGLWTFSGCGLGIWTIVSQKDGQKAETALEIQEEGQLLRYHVALRYSRIPVFSYTGDWELVDDYDAPITASPDHWKLRLLSSGTLTISEPGNAEDGVDVFLVGGATYSGYTNSGGKKYGAGGEYQILSRMALATGVYEITVGEGGSSVTGGDTSAFGITALGGRLSYAPGNTVPQERICEFGEADSLSEKRYCGTLESTAVNAPGPANSGTAGTSTSSVSYPGGSGIVIIRNTRE